MRTEGKEPQWGEEARRQILGKRWLFKSCSQSRVSEVPASELPGVCLECRSLDANLLSQNLRERPSILHQNKFSPRPPPPPDSRCAHTHTRMFKTHSRDECRGGQAMLWRVGESQDDCGRCTALLLNRILDAAVWAPC